MPRGEVASFIPKNIITRSLGPQPEVQVDLEGPYPLEVGDTFLLCSDGLSGQVKDEEIGPILSTLSPNDACRVLVDMANLRGGPDNITAIVVKVAQVPPEQELDDDEPPPAAVSAPTPVHPMIWIVMGVCLAGALGLALAQFWIGALLGGLLAALAAVVALGQSIIKSPHVPAMNLEGPFGAGPHATFDAAPTAESAAMLAQMGQQLREAAKDEHWTLDWGRFNAYCEQGQAAVAGADFSKAVREYSLSIIFMMSEIRRQPARKDQRDRSVLDL
jgi:PPM family protein phosphatase